MDDSNYARDYSRVSRYGAAGNYDHGDFLRRIEADPGEHTASYVYADWLQDNGHEGAADLIRRQYYGRSGDGPGFYDTAGDPTPAYRHHTDAAADYEPALDLYTTLPGRDGEKRYILSMMAKNGKGRRIGFLRNLGPEEAHSFVSRMPAIRGADQAKAELESRHRYLAAARS